MRRIALLSLVPVLCLFLLSIVWVPHVYAQQTLEIPPPGSFQSGVGIISGWACEAQTIEISFDGGLDAGRRLKAATGTIREDTQGACGDTDNGFGLLYNWNRLRDGVHTVTAYADGVEFASVSVTVTTLGEQFREELRREVTVSDFPEVGTATVLQWQEAQQNFVITAGSPQGGGTSGAAPHVLEIPPPGSFQSGVGIISGWACEAQTIEISFDGGLDAGRRLKAATGTIREDTQGVCGDTDNGFGLLYNWNRLRDGVHTVTAYADGVEFASVTVTVTTLGKEFREELRREVTVSDFPEVGTATVLQWQEAKQNFVITQTTSTPVSAHFIPDANLRRAVGEALGKPPGAAITKAELATLRSLTAYEYGIVDLTGLEFATNLTWLTLSRNAIEDFTPLAGLTNLTVLWLNFTAIEDLTSLAGLTNLTVLELNFTAIEDLTPLAGLPNLTVLSLNSTAIEDFTPLAGLTNLKALHLSSTAIEDLTPLAGLANLTRLTLSGTAIEDFTPLAGLANLTDLSLNFTAIEDLTPLAGLTNLTGLSLHSTAIEDLTPLAGLTNLTDLYLSSTAIEDFTPLAGLTNLTDLYLSSTAIEDLTPLAGLTNLTWLSLSSTAIEDLTPLAGLPNLTVLSLNFTAIEDFTPLAGLPNLTALYLHSTAIEDLTPLAGLTNLTVLSLNSTAIKDLTPLAGLTNLTELTLSSTAIKDLTPLAGLTNLTWLILSATAIEDLTPLFGLTKLDSLGIDGAPVRQEDLDTLARAGVAIDGSPFFIGAVDIHHDNVIVMRLSELPVTGGRLSDLTRRRLDYIPIYTRRIYQEFEDAFDYLMFVFNLDEKPEGFPYGFYDGVRNDTQGIGQGTAVDPLYSSQEQLRGVAFFPYRSAIRFGPSLHELLHCWANFVVPTGHGGHWGFSSANGQLGGFPLHDLVHLGGNRYKAGDFGTIANGGNSVPYSPIELYLAGLIPPDEVPDLWVAEDGEWLIESGEQVLSDDGQPIFTATDIRTVTIDDIIAEHGERVPDWTISQKDFQAAVVLLVDDDHPATPAQIQEVSDHVSWFSYPGNDDSYLYNFYEATGGRATITMDGLSAFLLPD